MKSADLVRYIESLTLTHGAKAGHPFKLLAWQRAFVRGTFKRGVHRAALSVPRGPGKTTLLAAVAAAAVDGPLRVPRGEVVVVASSFEQAKILFGALLAFTGTQGDFDKRLWRKHDTAQRASLEHLPTGCRVKAIASDPRRAHGLRPSLVIADEPAQWPSSTTDAMYAALNTALGKSPNSRLICIGTRSADSGHWFEKLLKDADYSLCHAAEPEDDAFDEATWTKALPQLRRLPHLLKTFRDEAHAAERDAALLAQFRALRLNMGVSDVVVLYLLSPEQWLAAEGLAEKSGPCFWAIDLGATAAMSAVSAYWPDTGRLDAVAAFPSNPPLKERERQDGVKPGLYQRMFDRGELLLLGDKVVPVAELLSAAQERLGYPDAIACDRWRLGELHDGMTTAALLAPVTPRGMGFKDGSEDVRLFKTSFLEGRVKPRQSLLLRSAVSETRLVQDPAGNSKIAKAGEGNRRRNGRDDPAVASVLAVALAERIPKRTTELEFDHIPLDDL